MLDPVCGMQVDEQSASESSEYQGKRYFFCSTDCKEEFDDDPEKYVGWGGESRVQGFA